MAISSRCGSVDAELSTVTWPFHPYAGASTPTRAGLQWSSGLPGSHRLETRTSRVGSEVGAAEPASGRRDLGAAPRANGADVGPRASVGRGLPNPRSLFARLTGLRSAVLSSYASAKDAAGSVVRAGAPRRSSCAAGTLDLASPTHDFAHVA